MVSFCSPSFHHFGHRGALFRAIATRLGASGQVFVIWKLFASCRTFFTAFGAAFAGVSAQGTLASAKGSAHLAAFRTVHAQIHALGVLFFPFCYQTSAMLKTRITLNLAIGANRSTLEHMRRMRAIRWWCGSECSRGHRK
jgi:hypothetical protein